MRKTSIRTVAFLVLVLCLSLCACGGGNDTPETTDTPTETTEAPTTADNSITLNETKTTDKFEITLTQVEFASYLVDPKDPYAVPTESFLPTNESSDIKASEDETLLMYSVNLKYIGKEEIPAVLGGFTLSYGDGYTFNDHDVYISSGGGSWIQVQRTYGSVESSFYKFKPLDDTQYILRGYFIIPAVVESEEGEPLTLTLKILGQEFDYTIR